MPQPRVIVIGAGLGGLLVGKILSGKGCAVTLLEQGAQPGGALQTFVRGGIRFDTGFHAVGGLGPGEPLEQLFRPLGLMELPWLRMEPDELIGCDEAFLRLSSGREEEKAHVLTPYSQSVWRLAGGGKTLVDALAAGQRILLRKRVTALEDRCVHCADGSQYQADLIVSDIHPLSTMRMVRDRFRPAYLHRLEKLENGPGIFTVYVKLKPGVLPYCNHAIFLEDRLMIHFGEAASDGSARSIDLLAFETPDQVRGDERRVRGDGRRVRGDERRVWGDETGPDRASRALALIQIAAGRFPGLSAAVEQYWTSTPATWERYTGTPGGSAYGIRKCGPQDYLAPQTPLPWLYLTGQNIGLHGVLGTAVSALNTCKTIAL